MRARRRTLRFLERLRRERLCKIIEARIKIVKISASLIESIDLAIRTLLARRAGSISLNRHLITAMMET